MGETSRVGALAGMSDAEMERSNSETAEEAAAAGDVEVEVVVVVRGLMSPATRAIFETAPIQMVILCPRIEKVIIEERSYGLELGGGTCGIIGCTIRGERVMFVKERNVYKGSGEWGLLPSGAVCAGYGGIGGGAGI